MPFNLTIVNQLSQPWINTLITLFAVLVGGLITYLVAYKRQKYELRRDAYLAFIGLRIKGSHPTFVEWTKNSRFREELFLAWYKIDLIGSKCIKKISTKMVLTLFPKAEIIDDKYKIWYSLTETERAHKVFDIEGSWNEFKNICDYELKPEIKKELESWWPFDPIPSREEAKAKHWYQFWK